MSWLSLPLPNPFKSLQETDEKFSEKQEEQQEDEEEERDQQSPSRGAGVKEDLSELGKTIGRQLWGVASFLAPPPSTASAPSEASDSSSLALLGIRNDFAEIGGSFKSRLSMISTNRAVDEISKLASNLLQFEDEEDGRDDEWSEEGSRGGNVGVTEEVLEFVREMSMRPECWIDFPLSLDDYDFDMSNAQREHALTVEHLAPGLVALKNKLCQNHMNEGHFWIIYFISLHPRLSKHDLELLSTPQILEARDLLLQKLQNKEKAQSQTSKADDFPLDVRDKRTEVQEVSSPVEKQEALVRTVNIAYQEEDVDQWLEEDAETGTSQNQLGNEQDVSFSDLEDDDDNDTSTQPSRSSPLQNARVSSPSGSSGWVQLSENSKTKGSGKKKSRDKDSEGESSNEWLTVDDFDSDSVGPV